jgi:L-ascorbate metabolism protein UlaG (beta-lactamase superfamily)
MKLIARTLIGVLFATSCAAAGLDDFKDWMLAPAPKAEAGKKQLTVMFIGVATLLFDDGETAIMTDGYFSRPTQNELRSITPDRAAISKALKRAGVTSLAAVIPVHSHFDHALDSPIVAMETGALLVGSSSTANIGRGQGVPRSAHPGRVTRARARLSAASRSTSSSRRTCRPATRRRRSRHRWRYRPPPRRSARAMPIRS